MEAVIIIGLAFAIVISAAVAVAGVAVLTVRVVRGVQALIHRRRQAWRDLRQQVDQVRRRQTHWAADAVCEQPSRSA